MKVKGDVLYTKYYHSSRVWGLTFLLFVNWWHLGALLPNEMQTSKGNLVSAGFTIKFAEVGSSWINNWSVRYDNDIIKISRTKWLLACNKEIMFHHRESGYRNWQVAASPLVHIKWFEKVEAAAVERVICLAEREAHRIKVRSYRPPSAIRLVKLFLNKIASKMKGRAFGMDPGHAVFPNFITELIRNLIYIGQTMLRFIPVEYDVDNNTGRRRDECNCRVSRTTGVTSVLEHFKNVLHKNQLEGWWREDKSRA